MEINGKIIVVLPKQTGISTKTNNPWATQEYVMETHDQYPRKCCFKVFGEDKINSFNIKEGDELTVSIDINAREYQGRWYNDINAWSVKREPAAEPAVMMPEVQTYAAPEPSQEEDSLPF